MQHTPITGIHDVMRITDAIPESDDPVLRHARSIINKSLFGSLTVEFDCRRVVLTNVRGDAALRFHAIVKDRREGDPSSDRWADQSDPRYSVADSRLVTFEVARVMAVLWEPERLIHGDAARRKILAACIRIVQTAAQHKDPSDWDQQDFADYGAVVLNMEPVNFAGADDGDGPEPESDDDDAAEEDDDPEPDPDSSGGAAATERAMDAESAVRRHTDRH